MIYTYLHYKKKRFELSDLMAWEIFFIILLIIILAPVRISMEIKKILGLGRGLDALFATMIGLSYLILFKLYLDIDRIEREITELTRNFSIRLKEIEDKINEKKIEKN
ncbi:hypothetical protein Py04_1473 [Pyrococcus sp. ST04]|nr:hypothetical protein Py04_1473 [Pyrococcus sp. ST04]